MIFAILTLLTAFALAGVAGWFSIIGIMAILAGSPMHALVAGVVIESAKLVTTSWIYRNWAYASWKLRSLLMFFTAIIMLVTSMGVFGFLSKAHLEQAAPTIDNGAKVEALDRQIDREKSTIANAERTLLQLDATLDSYIGKDRADRSVVIRRRQEPQRKQLKEEITAAQQQIDVYSEEKFELQSQVRELELKVGPIRYIAELIYGSENNSDKDIENAVKIFILLLVLTLDPLAVTLLVAANSTLLRLKNEKEKKIAARSMEEHSTPANGKTANPPAHYSSQEIVNTEASTATHPIPGRARQTEVHDSLPDQALETVNEKTEEEPKDKLVAGTTRTGDNTGSAEVSPNKSDELDYIRREEKLEGDSGAREETSLHDALPKETVETVIEKTETAIQEDTEDAGASQQERGPGPIQRNQEILITEREAETIHTPTSAPVEDSTEASVTHNSRESGTLAEEEASLEVQIAQMPTQMRPESSALSIIRSPALTRVISTDEDDASATQSSVLNELLGVKRYSGAAKDSTPHFVPLKVKETESADPNRKDAKYPRTLGWLKEFTRT